MFSEYELLKRARKAIEPLWKKACLAGAVCWGRKSQDNSFSGRNIIFSVGKDLVSISQAGDELVIHEFREAANTSLGNGVKKILSARGLNVKN